MTDTVKNLFFPTETIARVYSIMSTKFHSDRANGLVMYKGNTHTQPLIFIYINYPASTSKLGNLRSTVIQNHRYRNSVLPLKDMTCISMACQLIRGNTEFFSSNLSGLKANQSSLDNPKFC